MTTPGRIPWPRLIAESLAICIGVALGLLADDWRQDRIDRRAETLALQDLLRDLEADAAELATVERRGQLWNSAGRWVLRNRSVDVHSDVAADSLRPLISNVLYQTPNSTYNSLVASGRFELIRSDILRRRITEYYDGFQFVVRQLAQESYGDWFLRVRNASAPYLHWTVDATAESLRDTSGRIQLVQPWLALAADPLFVAPAADLGLYGEIMRERAHTALEANAALRHEIEMYLN